MSRYFCKRLENLEPYKPGEQPQDQKYIKLNTNESPYPPSPWVKEVLNGEEPAKLRLYPDPACKTLISAIATRYDVEEEQVMVGNGSDEVLFFAIRAFCDEQTPLVFANVTYGCYQVWANMMRLNTRIIPLEADFSIDPTRYYEAGGTVVIANPNAPTGIALEAADIEGILQHNPDNVVIVDEAYVDFGAESCLPLIERYPNLLVVQTFSKSHNLAGARIGFAMGNAELIADLNRIKFSLNPYNINRMSMLVGAASMQDVDYFRKCCTNIINTREEVAGQLLEMGFEVLPSSSNFLFVRTDKMNGRDLYLHLKSRGVLVRHFPAPRISGYVRITIGTKDEMKAFLAILQDVLAGGEENA